MTPLVQLAVVTLGFLLTFPTLVFARGLVLFDQVPNRVFGESVRAVIPWRTAIFIAPLLPLYALTWDTLDGEWMRFLNPMALRVTWVALGLILVEIYSVCLHRESWIAAFEPQWIPEDAAPLGGSPARQADRRLQHILRNHIAFALPLLAVGLLIPLTTTGATLIASLFLLKYFAFSNGDFEACVHWNMHCGVLDVRGRPRLTRLAEAMMDYIVGPLNGYVPRVYNTNHLLVHHWRNSGPDDIHSPTPFRRSSFLEFCVFSLQVTGSVLFATDLAFHRRCRGRARRVVIANVLGYWMVVIALWLVDRQLLGFWLIVFAVHHGVTMARFQYVWHGLIDPADPTKLITSTNLWVAGPAFWQDLTSDSLTGAAAGTQSGDGDRVPDPSADWAFFDNYHLLHHLRPRAHFTQYPELLRELAPGMVRARSVVLTLDGMETFAFDCWSGNVTKIARYLLTDVAPAEKEAFLRARLEPVATHRHPVATVSATSWFRAVDAGAQRLLYWFTGGK